MIASHTWRKWPTLLLDFGHELYIPWRLSEGQVLYRDVAFLYGPLSQYFNALLFQIFGVSLSTLIYENLLILAAIVFIGYRFFSDEPGRLTAAAACVFFLLVFAFSHLGISGNFNFICPYSHEATHGIALCTAMIFLLCRNGGSDRPLSTALAGFLFGLTALTRVEIFTAAVGAVTAWIIAISIPADHKWKLTIRAVMVFIAGALASLVIFFLFLLGRMPVSDAVFSMGGSFKALFSTGVHEQTFFKGIMGLVDPGANGLLMVESFLTMAAFVAAVLALDYFFRKQPIGRYLAGGGIGIAVIIISTFRPGLFRWDALPRSLPLVCLSLTAWFLVSSWRRRHDHHSSPIDKKGLVWSVFSLLLLAKIFLKVTFSHYGFYLAMPAALALVVFLVGILPRSLERAWAGGRVFRLISLAVVLAGAFFFFRTSLGWYDKKDYVVGRGGDAIVTYGPQVSAVGVATAYALERIEELAAPSQTMVFLPEGVMLNYLSRRINPTRYHTFMMTEMSVFGEGAILTSLKQAQPDFIVLVERSTSEFGVGYFGADPRYGARIMEWVDKNYDTVELIGNEPLKDGRFGIKILKRRGG